MKNYIYSFFMIGIFIGLVGCASATQQTPCPQFGAYCKKIRVNSWNYL